MTGHSILAQQRNQFPGNSLGLVLHWVPVTWQFWESVSIAPRVGGVLSQSHSLSDEAWQGQQPRNVGWCQCGTVEWSVLPAGLWCPCGQWHSFVQLNECEMGGTFYWCKGGCRGSMNNSLWCTHSEVLQSHFLVVLGLKHFNFQTLGSAGAVCALVVSSGGRQGINSVRSALMIYVVLAKLSLMLLLCVKAILGGSTLTVAWICNTT